MSYEIDLHSPQMRVAVNTYIKGGVFDAKRAEEIVARIARAVAKSDAVRYGFDYDSNSTLLNKEIEKTVHNIGAYFKTSDREAVQAVRRILPRGLTIKEREKRIADTMGLDRRRAVHLEKYRQSLGQAPKSSVDNAVKRQRAYLLRERANQIAQVETARLISAAREAQLKDAVFNGELPISAQKEWHTERGGCKFCDALNGKRVRIGEPWHSQVGMIEYPPAHPNCRCHFTLEGAG